MKAQSKFTKKPDCSISQFLPNFRREGTELTAQQYCVFSLAWSCPHGEGYKKKRQRETRGEAAREIEGKATKNSSIWQRAKLGKPGHPNCNTHYGVIPRIRIILRVASWPCLVDVRVISSCQNLGVSFFFRASKCNVVPYPGWNAIMQRKIELDTCGQLCQRCTSIIGWRDDREAGS